MKKNTEHKLGNKMALAIAAILIPFSSFSQVRIDWQQCYGNASSMDWATSILPTEEGYLVLGTVYHPNNPGMVSCGTENNKRTAWLLRIEGQGELMEQQCWPSSQLNNAISIKEAKTGNDAYYMNTHEYGDVTIRMIDGAFNETWSRRVGYFGTSMFPTDDGGVLLGGSYGSWGKNRNEDSLLKLDRNGNAEWGLSLGLPGSCDDVAVFQAKDGDYYVLGPIETGTSLIRIGRNGQIEWRRNYGENRSDILKVLVELEDGLLLGGRVASGMEGHHGDRDAWLVRTDEEGNVLWSRCYGGSYFDGCNTVFHNPNGGFTVFANSNSNDGDVESNSQGAANVRKIWVFHVDPSGELQLERSFGAVNQDVCCNDVAQTKDYQYVVAGWARWEESYSGDVNCSNIELIPGSGTNYWVLHVTDTINSAGLDEPLQQAGMQLYPNPTDGTVFIMGMEPTEVRVYDALGQWVKTYRGTDRVFLGDLPKGLYLIKATCEDGKICVGKVVKE